MIEEKGSNVEEIKSLMNKRIRDYIRSKNKPTLEFLGCSMEYFKKWTESQFDEKDRILLHELTKDFYNNMNYDLNPTLISSPVV
jgi:hypothetical protein